MEGKIQYYSINQSTLLVARLPLFGLLTAAVFKIFGVGMLQIRAISAVLGLFSTILIYVSLRSIFFDKQKTLPLLAALLYAVYPSAVIYNRMGFSYNLITPLAILIFWGCYKYWQTKEHHWLVMTSIAAGLACAVDLMAFSLLIFVFIVLLLTNYKKIPLFLGIAILPFAIYSIFMIVTVPQAFIFDLQFTFFRVQHVSILEQVLNVFVNNVSILLKDRWMIFGLLGFLFIKPKRFGQYALFFLLLPILFLGRVLSLFGLSYYYLIPLFPFIAIGCAGFIEFCSIQTVKFLENASFRALEKFIYLLNIKKMHTDLNSISRFLSAIILSTFVVPSIIFFGYLEKENITNGWQTTMDHLMINVTDAKSTSQFINQHVSPNDLVIASPAVAWMYDCNHADFQVSQAYSGNDTMHLPGDIPPERFLFPSNYQVARYIVVDPIWVNWAVEENANIASMVQEVETWPLVWATEKIQIYANPLVN